MEIFIIETLAKMYNQTTTLLLGTKGSVSHGKKSLSNNKLEPVNDLYLKIAND